VKRQVTLPSFTGNTSKQVNDYSQLGVLVEKLLTPKQVAQAIGVSESSLKRWCDQGLIPNERTAGGHRRLPLAGVVEFLQRTDRSLARPELLGLPRASGPGPRSLERACELLSDALIRGDEEACRQTLFDLFLAGHPLDALGDRVIAPAFERIGQQWDCGDVEVYQERRACEICGRVLSEIRSMLPSVRTLAPIAFGGTVEGDQYRLPTMLVEAVLRQRGWNAQSFGTSLPFATLAAALVADPPELFWLSVSHVADPDNFVPDFNRLYEVASGCGVSFVVGGRGLDESLRRQLRYTAFCDQLAHLVSFDAALAASE